MRLGIRAQIVLSLTLIFLLSAPLLVTVTLQLSRRATELQRQQVMTAAEGLPDDALSDTAQLRRNEHALQRMLVFYVALTWLGVIALAYVLLTLLIVRPLESLVRASRALAGGHGDTPVPERGPAELYRLSTAFNAMAAELSAERIALQDRVDALQRTSEALSQTQQRLVHGEKLATVGRMAAGVAHEIGNPLAAILGMVELLSNAQVEPDEQQEFLTRIQAETERIHGIIGDLLAFSRRDAPGAEAQAHATQLATVIEDAVALLSPQKQARQVTIDVQVPADLPRVAGAQSKLTQVVLNLLLNAVDAIAGQGRIEVTAERVDAGQVRVSVRDDGPGIAPQMLQTLFEPFATTKPVGQGTGLGLSVCHSLVEGMGGTIEAHNLDTGGACFEVCLPVAPD